MDFINLTSEEVKNLSTEEKREFVRSLIHSEAAEVHAAFFNPHTNETVTMSELAERLGEEKAIDLIVKMIDSAETKTLTLNKDEVKELILKAKRGDCTPEELAMLQHVTATMEAEDNIQFERNLIDITINLIHFAQEEVPYNPQIHDMLSAITVLTIVSMVETSKGILSNYNVSDGPTISEMASTIAEDMYDTWKASCTTLPEKELIVIGLLQLASKIAFEERYKFADATVLANPLGVELNGEVEYEGENKIDEASEHDTSNGSNTDTKICKSIIHDPSDENMRDLLKD